MIKILLVDDQELIRIAIRDLLARTPNIKVIGEANSGEAVLELLKTISPDIIFMDLAMPDMSGLVATRTILEKNPNIKIIVLTANVSDPFPTKMFQAGAKGYLSKGSSLEEMLNAIKIVSNGEIYLGSDINHQLAVSEFLKKESPIKQLSGRELQILNMMLQSYSPQEISAKLSISVKTVYSFQYRIHDKLNIKNNMELLLFAIKYNLIEKLFVEQTPP